MLLIESGFPASAPHPLLVLVAAVIVEAGLGALAATLPGLPRPEAWLRNAAAELDRRLNRPGRGERTLAVRGAIAVALLVLPPVAVAAYLQTEAATVAWGWVLHLGVLLILLGAGRLYRRVRAVGRGLETGRPEAARRALAALCRRDVGEMDDFTVARTAIEAGADGFVRRCAAPVLWYLIGGLPGAALAWSAGGIAVILGRPGPGGGRFAWIATRLDNGLAWLPDGLAALLIAAAALVAPGANPWRAARGAFRRTPATGTAGERLRARAALAGAFDLSLGGPARIDGRSRPVPWIGDGRARVGPVEIRQTLLLLATACLILSGLLAAVLLGLARF